MTSTDREGIKYTPARRVKNVGPVGKVVDDDQVCVAFLMAVILVVLGNCEGRIYNLLHLLRIPIVEEVLLLLLVELVAHMFFTAPQVPS